MSLLPLLRNTSSSQGAPNGERYPPSIAVHAGGGVTFHPPGFARACCLGRGLCSPPTSVSQYMCFSFHGLRRARDMPAGAPPLLFKVTTVPSHLDADLNGSTLALSSNPHRAPWGPTDTTEASASTTSLAVVSLTVTQLSRCSHPKAFQNTGANHFIHECIEDHLLADTSTFLAQRVMVKLSHGMIQFFMDQVLFDATTISKSITMSIFNPFNTFL